QFQNLSGAQIDDVTRGGFDAPQLHHHRHGNILQECLRLAQVVGWAFFLGLLLAAFFLLLLVRRSFFLLFLILVVTLLFATLARSHFMLVPPAWLDVTTGSPHLRARAKRVLHRRARRIARWAQRRPRR